MEIDMNAKPAIDFDKFLIDLSQNIEEPQPLILIGEKPLFTRGNISCISGKAKSRKTFLIGLFAAQYLEGAVGDVKIIIFDTEQAQFHTQKSTRRIHRLLDWDTARNNERLLVFNLREQTAEARIEFVKGAITHFRPDIVFIDGVRDLLKDFNNISESSEVVGLLMKLSSETNCHICAVLHENKGDNSLRGHAGTELQNKSETVISVEMDGDTSKVSPKYCRNMPFTEFYFRVNADGLPELCDPEMKPKNTDKIKALFDEILPATAALTYSDLKDKVMQQCSIKSTSAENKIKQATEHGVIMKNVAGLYYIPATQPDEPELPF